MTELDTPEPARRLLPLLARLYRDRMVRNFESIFVFSVLLLIGFILYFCEQRLTYLNLYLLPVLLAGYFMGTRSAVLGSVLSILVVGFFVVTRPESFLQEMSQLHLYLHLSTWGSLLILTGAMTGAATEQLQERFRRARSTLEQLNELQEQLRATNRRLEEKNLALEGIKTKVESVLHYTMDPIVAQLVINRQLRNEKREISVLFADLENFTAHMEAAAPEVSVRDLNRLFTSMEPILAVHRGHLDKYIGDGLMAEFGVPYFSEQHALLATLAGLRMQARMAQRDFPWKMRIGISTGPALVGLMGSENRRNYTAIGDTVNVASRLQALCPTGGVCIDERTHAAVSRWFHTRRIRRGLSNTEAQRLEDNLAALEELIHLAPRLEHCLRAAQICALLGEPERAMSYERRALEMEPASAELIERSTGKALLEGDEHAHVSIRGRRARVAAFEVLGMRDPLDERARVPRLAADIYEQFSREVRLSSEALVPLEAVQGALGHGQVTAALAATLGDTLGLAERERRDAFLAGALHDIGKRNVPEALLTKPSQNLTPSDQEMLRAHVVEAEVVLRELGLPAHPELVKALRHHHERFDGGGYPSGLKGDAIPLVARVVQLAAEYETLTGWRPHHEPWNPRAALIEIERNLDDGKFDPKVGQIFLRMMRAGIA